ncbi:MAG: N-acetylmuramoyl-L-alanine amidase [Bacteroidota bacterium]
MMKSILLPLTFLGGFFPFNPFGFNLSFTPDPPTKTEKHIHSATCSHHQTTNIAFGEELGKIVKESNNEYQIRTVVLDPGHGGKDPGCSGATSREKHLALGIAKELSMQLQTNYPNIRVILTRDRDEFIPLNKRAEIANSNNADLFISIHCNYIKRYTGTKGTETYVLGLHRAEDNLNVAKRENASILYEEDYEKTYDGFDPDSDEGHIILSMYQSAFLEQSILFGSLVEHKFAAVAKRKSRGVKQAGFLVLRETTMPSVLVETGFLSNRAEEAYLRSRNGQRQIANSIFEAFRIYKNTVEGGETPAAIVASLKEEAQESQNEALETLQANVPASKPANVNLPTRVEETPTEVQIAEINPQPIDPNALDFNEELTGEALPINKNEIAINEVIEALELIQTINEVEEEASPMLETPEANMPETEEAEQEVVLVNQKPTMPQPRIEESAVQSITINQSPRKEQNQTIEPEPISIPSPIQFRVQIAASKTKLTLREDRWQRMPYIVEVVWEGNMHKYQIRNLDTFDEAQRVRTQMLHKGFMGAFIVAYKDGRRLSNKELYELR